MHFTLPYIAAARPAKAPMGAMAKQAAAQQPARIVAAAKSRGN